MSSENKKQSGIIYGKLRDVSDLIENMTFRTYVDVDPSSTIVTPTAPLGTATIVIPYSGTTWMPSMDAKLTATTEEKNIRQLIENIVDVKFSQNMPLFEKVVESLINKKLEQIEMTPIQIIEQEITTNNLTKDQVKQTILQATKIGDVYYPSDLASKFGMDLKTVVEVIEELKQEGKFKEKNT